MLQLKVDWNFYYKGIISMLFDSGHSLEMSTSQIFLELGFKEKEDRVARIFYSSVSYHSSVLRMFLFTPSLKCPI